MIPYQVVSYSSEAMFPEQVASNRSFIRHAGRPEKFTVVSDGSHSEESVRLLQSIDPSWSRLVFGQLRCRKKRDTQTAIRPIWKIIKRSSNWP